MDGVASQTRGPIFFEELEESAMFRNVIVPVDGSDPSNAAVELAMRLAREEGASITFAHVVEVPRISAMASSSVVSAGFAVQSAREAGAEILEQAKAQAAGVKIAAQTELLEGECVGALLTFALKKGADLIVVGSHGRSGISRALVGSIAEGILRRSRIPVLVTRVSSRKAESVTLLAVP